MKTATGKSLGFKKGDCIETGERFVGVIMSDVHTYAPCCEVWGLAHEGGSVYATDLHKVSPEYVKNSEYFKEDPHPFSPQAQKALGVK